MDVEQIISEIEGLERIFAVPDTRPLSPSDLSATNRKHDEVLAHSPWFRLCSTTALGRLRLRNTIRLSTVERSIGRPVNPTVYSVAEFKSKLAGRNHFLTAVLKGQKVFLLGDEDELRKSGWTNRSMTLPVPYQIRNWKQWSGSRMN